MPKVVLVNGDDDYWSEVAEGYDDGIELWLIGANATVSARHQRWLRQEIGGEYSKLRDRVRFRSLRELMGGDAYDAM